MIWFHYWPLILWLSWTWNLHSTNALIIIFEKRCFQYMYNEPKLTVLRLFREYKSLLQNFNSIKKSRPLSRLCKLCHFKMTGRSCTDEVRVKRFVRGGPTLTAFFLTLMRGERIQIPLLAGHQRPASETPFKWRFAGGPMMVQHWMLAW